LTDAVSVLEPLTSLLTDLTKNGNPVTQVRAATATLALVTFLKMVEGVERDGTE
jgi:hypothetical protein